MNVDQFIQRDLSRRQFLGRSAQNAAGMAAGVVGLAGAASLVQAAASERVRVAVIGVRNQGKTLASSLAALPDAQVVTLCDVDDNVLPAAVEAVWKTQGMTPRTERDFRKVLDDPRVDAVVIATPDHWHAAMTIAACEAGKDVYVETPVTHRLEEGAAVLEAAAKHQRVVAIGLQQRSGSHFQSAVQLVQSGQLGKVTLAKAWFVQRRQPISAVAPTDPPAGVDYAAWLGPAPDRPFASNHFHFYWRWFRDYGSGELGVWGSQLLDVARWGLNVDRPQRVLAVQGDRVWNDAAETPDTLHVQFDCGNSTVIWEHRSWSNHAPEGRTAGVAFYGERGTLVVDRGGWKVYDSAEPLTSNGSDQLTPHLANFLACVKSRSTPIADLETGLIASEWCQRALDNL